MKRYYIIITADSIIDDTSLFYKIAISETAAGQRDLQFIQSYCSEHGYFFAMNSHDVATFMLRVAHSLDMKASDLPIRMLDSHDLVSYLREYSSMPTYHLTGVQKQMLSRQSNICPASQRSFHVLRHAVAQQRNKPKVL